MAPKLGGPGEKHSHAVIIHYVDQVFVGSSTSFHALPCSDHATCTGQDDQYHEMTIIF
jgi:hypothetical protein